MTAGQVTCAGPVMMMSRSKAKGTAAESALVAALRRLGWPHAERLALGGSNDKGDTTGHPGLVFEQKDAKVWQAAAWLRETETERINAKADYGILVIKPPRIGLPNAEKWLTVMELGAAMQLNVSSTLYGMNFRTVTMKAVGIIRGYEELVERERHCGPTPVHVAVKMQQSPHNLWPGGYYSLMRLDARARLLVDAGYGGYMIKDDATSNIVKENDDG